MDYLTSALNKKTSPKGSKNTNDEKSHKMG